MNLSLFTYTHSNYKDLHAPYFSRIEKYFPELEKSYVACDIEILNQHTLLYNDEAPFYLQILNTVRHIPSDYILYSQEDFILYDMVRTDRLNDIISVLEFDDSIPFVRLMESGVGNHTIAYNYFLSRIDESSPYYYSSQATVWRKEVLMKMFEMATPQSIRDEPSNSHVLRQIAPNGLFCSERGISHGGHFDSVVYPYIATAVVLGKWNYSEYPMEMELLFREFDINRRRRELR
jgi:hypothetical protein